MRNLSREFIEFYGDDDHAWSDVLPLSRVIATGKGRPADADLTLFKAMGMGISDLSMGVEVLDRRVQTPAVVVPARLERDAVVARVESAVFNEDIG